MNTLNNMIPAVPNNDIDINSAVKYGGAEVTCVYFLFISCARVTKSFARDN